MSDPITAGVMKAGQAAGDILGAISEKKAAKANEKNAREAARIAENQAAAQSADIKNEGQRLRGAQVAAAGASGITLEGSPTEVIVESAVQNELDALRARYSGHVQAVGYRNQARAYKLQGNQALTAGIISAISPALKGSQLIAGAGKNSTNGYSIGGGGGSLLGARG